MGDTKDEPLCQLAIFVLNELQSQSIILQNSAMFGFYGWATRIHNYYEQVIPVYSLQEFHVDFRMKLILIFTIAVANSIPEEEPDTYNLPIPYEIERESENRDKQRDKGKRNF